MEQIKNLRITDPNKLLEELKIFGIPDVVKMVKSCGFEVVCADYQSIINSKLEKSGANIMCGIIVEKKKKKIYYSESLVPTTRKFVTAYLFSSYQLNCVKDEEYFEVLFDESIYNDKVYDYTLSLLMPDNIFKYEYEQNKNTSILAQRYNVSEHLVNQKIKKLVKEK